MTLNCLENPMVWSEGLTTVCSRKKHRDNSRFLRRAGVGEEAQTTGYQRQIECVENVRGEQMRFKGRELHFHSLYLCYHY